jgi:hypothetical protein
MTYRRTRVSARWIALATASVALVGSARMGMAQRGGGRGGAAGSGKRPVICIYDCPDPKSGLSDEDEAKIAHLIAVQASTDQSAAFANISKATQEATMQLGTLSDSLRKGEPATEILARANKLEDLLAKARTGNQNYVAALTTPQESGLKETTRKLTKAEADLDKEVKAFDRTLDPKPDSKQLAAAVGNLERALSSFQSEQLALGAEMSVVLPSERHEVAFELEPVTHPIEVGGRSISIPAAGAIAQSSENKSPDTYGVRFVADLSDLQDNMTGILRSLLNQQERCGQRVEILEATLVPQPPASLAGVHLHYERWICPPGVSSATELATGEGAIDVKLTASPDANGGVKLASQTSRVEAQGLLRDALLTGELGDNLREQVTTAVLAALQKTADVKNSLPPAVQASTTMQKVRFRDAGTGHLSLVLDGELKLSGDQTREFAAQLKQRLSAQGSPLQ